MIIYKLDSYIKFFELRQKENFKFDNFLLKSIQNYDQFKGTDIPEQLDSMLKKYGNPLLSENLYEANLRIFVRNFIENSKNSVDEYIGEYNDYGSIEKVFEEVADVINYCKNDIEAIKKDFPLQYLILYDEIWRQNFKQVLQDKINEIKKSKVVVIVKFSQENAKKEYQELCAKLEDELQNEKNEILKQIFASFIKFRYSLQQKQLFEEKDYLNLSQFEPKIQNPEDYHLVTYKNPYTLLPKGIEICIQKELSERDLIHNIDQILKHDDQYDKMIYEEVDEKFIEGDVEKQEFQKFEYFLNYFYYYKYTSGDKGRLQYAFVPEDILNSGKEKMQSTCFGLDELFNSSSMSSLLGQLKNPLSFLDCKGPLIYGPPGTGKTYIIEKIIDHFQIHLVFNGNSSNFQTSLVGQGSRLLTIYFNRARAIPWQPCAAHIGEIEELVQKKDSGGGGSSEVLNKLLELTAGTETVGNVKIFSTTNHIEKIEEAILSRFNLIYLGKSNTSLRRDWIIWYFMNQKKNIGRLSNTFEKLMKGFFPDYGNDYDQFLNDDESNQKETLKTKIHEIVQYTINFSTRQLTDLLSHITSKILEEKLRFETTNKEKLEMILECCVAKGLDQFKLGNQILPELIFQSLITKNNFPEDIENKFLQIVKNGEQLLNEQKQNEQLKIQQLLYGSQLNGQQLNSQQLQEQQLNEKYVHSKVILFDLSTDAAQRINVLTHYEKDNKNLELYSTAEKIYHQLIILISQKQKINEFKNSYVDWNVKDFNKSKKKLLRENSKDDQKEFQSHNIDSAKKILEESINDKRFEKSNVKKKLQELIEIKNKQIKIQDQFFFEIDYIKQQLDIDINKDSLNQINKDKDIKVNFERYEQIIDDHCKNLMKEFKKIISPQKIDDHTIQQILKQNKLYKLNYCELQEPSNEYIMKLLSQFIINGDFSKVDMVDYHSCERNKALQDVNSFKSYISNLIQEGKQEDKCLIVYKLDDFLNVSSGEDAELEKDKIEMAKKIFESINDTSNQKIWTVFISKNMNVIDLFYEVVQYWPRESERVNVTIRM